MLESIPLDVEDLWIGCFDTSGLTEFSFDRYLSLKSLVLGSNTLWNVTQFELNGLPQLQSVKLDYRAFNGVHSIVFESDRMDGLMIQICLNYNPFNLLQVLLMVIGVMIERQLAEHPSITRTH